MEPSPDILLPLLSTASHQLPFLIACAVALGLLWGMARPGKARTLGLTGAAILLLATLAGSALMMMQMVAAYSGTITATPLYGVLHMLLNVVSSAALVLIAYALCNATRTP